MSQAIITKIIAATNTKPMRIRAECARDAIIYNLTDFIYDNIEQLHVKAANEMCSTFIEEDYLIKKEPKHRNPWNNFRVCGQLESGDYVHVFINKDMIQLIKSTFGPNTIERKPLYNSNPFTERIHPPTEQP